jgi:hypothetical protein
MENMNMQLRVKPSRLFKVYDTMNTLFIFENFTVKIETQTKYCHCKEDVTFGSYWGKND